jgi:hypothetical protein
MIDIVKFELGVGCPTENPHGLWAAGALYSCCEANSISIRRNAVT